MNTQAVYVFAKWQVKDGLAGKVLETLAEVAKKSREEKGNLFYKAHQSTTDANTIVLFEGYADQAALEEHRNSVHFQTLVVGKIVPDLENREVIITHEVEIG